MSRIARHINMNATPQTEPVLGKQQVQNNAGGFVFQVDAWTKLDRFLILGTEGGSYYATEREMTLDNARSVEHLVRFDGERVVKRVVEISESGRAPKNGPAVFVLAMCAKLGNEVTKRAANMALIRVCRTGTHLFEYAASIKALGGWGSGTRRAIGHWYNDRSPHSLANQLAKYKQREGWSQRDVLRLAHPEARSPEHNALFHWAVRGELPPDAPDGYGVQFIRACEALKDCRTSTEVAMLIKRHQLPREVVPTEWLNTPEVWEALLEHMGPEAMIRNLGKMTAVGLLLPFSGPANFVAGVLGDVSRLREARLHPIKVLAALLTYQQGYGVKGSLSWNPVPKIVNALDEAFYATFKTIEPTGKRTLLALDVSGSMTINNCAGVPGLTPRVGSAAMAMVTAATEKDHHFMAFSHQFVPLAISPRQRLDDVVRRIDGLGYGATDCSLPMTWAMEQRVPVDTFVVYTDNETYFGKIHPFQALRNYRERTGINSKLIVVGMTATDFSIADPSDGGMLDVVGFDTAAPAIMADFAR